MARIIELIYLNEDPKSCAFALYVSGLIGVYSLASTSYRYPSEAYEEGNGREPVLNVKS